MIDRWQLRKTLAISWGFTLMGVLNVLVLAVLAAGLAIRFRGPAAVMAITIPLLSYSLLAFLMGEVLVMMLYNGKQPHPVRDERLLRVWADVVKKAGFWIPPRLRVIEVGMPNALACGSGFPGLSAVCVTESIVDMLDDDELAGVLAHECAHIRCKDIGLMMVVGIITGLLNKLRSVLSMRQGFFTQSIYVMAAGWAIYAIGSVAFAITKFSISQEREFAADALGASYVGDPRPLIRALTKLHESRPPKDSTDVRPLLHELMLSHPGLERRIASLQSLLASDDHPKKETV